LTEGVAPPQPDEIELSAFGPAYGESLLVHLGEGEWMIVDSCKKGDRLPVLDHLAAMGVDAAAVKLVVATHWHDDHVRGISEVVTACPNARFACSGVLCADELVQAIASIPPARLGHMTSGVKEMRAVFEVVAVFPLACLLIAQRLPLPAAGDSPNWLIGRSRTAGEQPLST